MIAVPASDPLQPAAEPALPGDQVRREGALLLAGSFAGDALIEWLLPSAGDREAARQRLFECLLGPMGGRLTLTADRQAVAVWFAGGETSSWWAEWCFFRLLVSHLGGPTAVSRGLGLKRLEKARVSGRHCYLRLLAVAPQQRRRGLGRALVNVVLARARLDGVPVCLETSSQANVGFYRSLGFEVCARTELTAGLTVWSMVCSPGPRVLPEPGAALQPPWSTT